MAITRKVQNNKAQSIFLNTGNIELPPSVTVDLYTQLSDDKLQEAQTELGILAANGSITVIETDEDVELKVGGREVLDIYTTTERDALSATAGMLIYNSTTNKLNFYNGTGWEAVTSA